MNKLTEQLTRIRKPTVRPLQRLTGIVAFMLAWTFSGQAWALSIKGRFSNPDIIANGVKACPDDVNGCSFNVDVLNFSVDAFVCPDGATVYPNETSIPSGCVSGEAHFDPDITPSAIAQLQECTKNGSCKINITDFFTIDGLAAAINGTIPGQGQAVATFVDTNETCPALIIRAMTVGINGFVCNPGGLNVDGSCTGGTQGSYYNAMATFDPLFGGSIFNDLCMHGDFTEHAQPDCYDNDGSLPDGYTCDTSYP